MESPETRSQYCQDLFAAIDKDNDGVIDQIEARLFFAGLLRGLQRDAADDSEVDTFKETFALFDTDNNGVVNLEEFSELMLSLVKECGSASHASVTGMQSNFEEERLEVRVTRTQLRIRKLDVCFNCFVPL